MKGLSKDVAFRMRGEEAQNGDLDVSESYVIFVICCPLLS